MTLAAYRGPSAAREAGVIAFWPRAPAVSGEDLPRIVVDIGADEIGARIANWRASDAGLDSHLREGAPPAPALRRLALTRWSAGDPRLASAILATAAALAPDAAPVWLDLGSTLHASGEAAEAARAFARAVALDPAPARAWLGLALAAHELADPVHAEAAYGAALARDPGLNDAAFGLGLICFEQRRYAEAAARWRAAVAGGCVNPMVLAGLGQSLFFLGDFAGAADALERHVASGPTEPELIRRFALSRYLAMVLIGDIAAAEAAYRAAAGSHAEPLDDIARSAFQILGGYGRLEAALRLGRERLDGGGDDPVQRYLIAAVAGEKLERAPRDYVVAYFDRFAETFDKQLVDILQYRVPERLLTMVAATGKILPRALDLGCGTGLAGPRIRAGRTRLVGVDLSPGMLAKAARRGVYDALIEAEMVGFLERTAERFDLVLAADALVYLGEVEAFFRAAARATVPGAILAFNIETTSRGPYRLLPCGRFAHSLRSVLAKAAPWFACRATRRAFQRIEAGRRVYGAMALLERRELVKRPKQIDPRPNPETLGIDDARDRAA
jgi:predicted TPR repeat methyltransferase